MTGSTLILIAMLSTGAIEWQPIDADICRKVLAALESGGTVIADRIDGSHLAITQGICVEYRTPKRPRPSHAEARP